MIFIDSNIPMYLVGAPHPHKNEAQYLLERLVAQRQRLVTDVAVFQEILHRYAAIGRREAIEPALQLLLAVADDVFSIEKADAIRAAGIVQSQTSLSARDSIHIAVMERYGVRSILSFDANFDQWPGLNRIHTV